MTARTKSRLVFATRSIGLAIPAFMSVDTMASILGPYSVDQNTIALYNFDEAAGAGSAANQNQFVPAGVIGFNQPTATAAGTPISTLLGAPGAGAFGFGNFGNAAAINPNVGAGIPTGTFTSSFLGYDNNTDGTYDPDFTGHTSTDVVGGSTLGDPSTGAFTIDALVNFGSSSLAQLEAAGNHEVVSLDSSGGRGFQFRVNSSGQLEYNNINDSVGSALAAIPTTGANAYAPNTWYQVAIAYDGTGTQSATSVRLYWTKLDDSITRANLIGTGSAGSLTTATANLTIGNENRNTAGEPLDGYVDELRISNTFRTANQFLFGGGTPLNSWNSSTGGDWDAGPWTLSTPNGTSAFANFGDGNNPPTADSVITLNGSHTVGTLNFDSAVFKYSLVSGTTAGTLVLDNGAGVPSDVSVSAGNHTIGLPVTLGTQGNNFTIPGGGLGTLTISGPISGAAGSSLSKLGTGVLVMTGTNTYTGITTVSGGAIRATDGVGIPSSSNITLNGGVLETGVNFARAAGAGAGQIQIPSGASGFSAVGADIQVALGTIASPTALTWGNTTFAPTTFLLNDSNATNAVTFLNAVNLGAPSRTVEVDAGTATLSGALTGTSVTGGLIKTGAGLLVLTGTNNYAGTTTLSAGTLRAVDGVGLSPNTNLAINGGIFDTSANVSRSFGAAAGQLQIPGGSSGFNANGADITISNNSTTAVWGSPTFAPTTFVLNTGTTNNINFAANVDLNGAARTVQVSNNTATFSGAISDSTANASGSTSLVKTGGGLLVLSGANTYGGTTLVSAGRLAFANAGAVSPNANLTLNGGLLESGGVTTTLTAGTGAGQAQISGGSSGFAATGADGTVVLTNGGSPIIWGLAPFNPGTLSFNAGTSTNNITLAADFDTNGAVRNIVVNNGFATMSGLISGTGSLQVSGNGILILSQSNSFTGGLVVNQNVQTTGTVRASASGALGTGASTIGPIGNSSLSRLELVNNITLSNPFNFSARSAQMSAVEFENISGNNELSGMFTLQTGGQNYVIQSDGGLLTLSGASAAAAGVSLLAGSTASSAPGGNRNITLQGAGNGVVSGMIVGNGTGGTTNGTSTASIIKLGTGNWTLSNAGNPYTGTTTVGGDAITVASPSNVGTLSVSTIGNGSVNSNIGASSNAATNLVLSGGALKYTGAAASTDRLFTVAASGGILDSSGAGSINFSNGGAIVAADPAARPTALNLNAGTTTILVANTYDLVPGMTVADTTNSGDIPAGTTITAVNPQLLSITISNPVAVASTAADTLSFTSTNRALVLTGSTGGILGDVLADSAGGAHLGVTKAGSGLWKLTSNNTYGGATTITGGTLELASNSQVPVLNFGGADIQGGHLVLDGASASAINTLLATSYNDQSAGTHFNHSSQQIRSTNATSAIGLGVSFASGNVTIARAYYGDANLDGVVNLLDLNAVATNFGTSSKVWSQGDFNYDGTVNIADFNALAANFGQVLPASAPVPTGAFLGALVPEPGTFVLAGLGMASLVGRRSRRKMM